MWKSGSEASSLLADLSLQWALDPRIQYTSYSENLNKRESTLAPRTEIIIIIDSTTYVLYLLIKIIDPISTTHHLNY